MSTRLESLEQALRIRFAAEYPELPVGQIRWIDAAKVRWEPRLMVPMNRTSGAETMALPWSEEKGLLAQPLFVRHQVLVVAIEATDAEDAYTLEHFVEDHR